MINFISLFNASSMTFDPNMLKTIVNLVVVLFCFLGFLGGVSKGIKKAGLRFLFFALAVGVSFALTSTVSGVLLQIKIPIEGVSISLKDFLVNQIASMPEIQEVFSAVPSALELIVNCVQMFMQIIVFILLVYIVGFIFWINYRICVKIAFKKKRAERREDKEAIKNAEMRGEKKPAYLKVKKHRLLGGLVCIVKGFLLLVFTLLPISTACGLIIELADAKEISAAETTTSESATATSKLLTEYLGDFLPYIRAVDGSVLCKIGHVGNLDTILFNSIAQTSVNKEKIVLLDEFKRVTQIYDDVSYIIELGNKEFDPDELNFTKFKRAINTFFDMGTLRSVGPDLIEYALDMVLIDEESTLEYKDEINSIITELANELDEEAMDTIKNDLLCLVNIAEIACKSGLVSEVMVEPIDFEEILNILIEQDYKVVTDLVDNFFDIITLKVGIAQGLNAGLSILEDVMLNIMPENVTSINLGRVDIHNVKWSDVKAKSVEFLKSAVGIYEVVQTIDFDNPPEDPADYLDMDYASIINNVMKMLDCIQGTPLLNSALSDADIYGNILNTLQNSIYGKYFYFTNINIDNFWSTQAPAFISIADCAKQMINVDFETVVWKDFDTTKIYSAISSVFDFGLIANIKPYVWTEIKSLVLEEDTFNGNIYEEEINDLIDTIFDTLASGHGAFDIIKNDLLNLYSMAEDILKSGTIDDILNLNIDFENEDEQSIMNKIQTFMLKLVANFKADNYKIADNLTNKMLSMSTVNSILPKAMNLALTIGEEALAQAFDDSTIKIGRIETIDFVALKADYKAMARIMLDSIVALDKTYEIAGESFNLKIDPLKLIDAFGKLIDQEIGLSIFDYGTNKNIITDILQILNAEYGEYFDFTLLNQEKAFEDLTGIISTIAKAYLNNTELYNLMKENFDTWDVDAMIPLLSQKTTVGTEEISFIRQIIEPIISNTLVGSGMAKNAHLLDEILDDVLNEIHVGSGVEIINGNALNTLANREVLIDIIDKIFDTFVSAEAIDAFLGFEIDGLLNSIDFAKLGSIFDLVKNWQFVADVDGKDGIFTSFVNALAQSDISEYVNFNITLDENYSFETDFEYLQNALNVLNDLTIIPEGEAEPVSLLNYLTGTSGNVFDALKVISTTAVAPQVSDAQIIFDNILNCQLIEKCIVILVNYINETMCDELLIEYTPIVWYDGIREQKAEISEIFVTLLDFVNSSDLSEISLNSFDLEKLGSILDLLKTNAQRNVGEGNTSKAQGIFKFTYETLIELVDEESQGFIDVSVQSEANYSFEADFGHLVDALNVLETVVFIPEGQTEPVDAKTFLLDTFDFVETFSNISTEVVAPAEQSKFEQIINSLFECKLIRGNIVLIVNVINEAMFAIADNETYVALVWGDNILEQKDEIIDVAILAMDYVGTEAPTNVFDMCYLLDAIKINAYRNVGEGNTDNSEGVFKQSFDLLVAEFGSMSSAVLDVSVIDQNYSFVDDMQHINNILDIFEDITFIPDEEVNETDGKTYFLETFDFMTVFAKVNDIIVAPATKSDMEVVLENIYDCKLIKNIIVTIVNGINQGIYNLVGDVTYVDLVFGDNFVEQKSEIITIIIKSLNADFTGSFDITTIDTNVIGETFNAIKVNAYRNVGEGNTLKTEGVFKNSYQKFVTYLGTTANGDEINALLDMYSTPQDVDWKVILSTAKSIAIEGELNSNVKTIVAEFVYSAKGNDIEYKNITNKFMDMLIALDTNPTADEILTVITGASGLSNLAEFTKSKVDTVFDLFQDLSGIVELEKLKNFDFYTAEKMTGLAAIKNIKPIVLSIDENNALTNLGLVLTELDNANITTQNMNYVIDFVADIASTNELNSLKDLDYGAENTKLDSIDAAITTFTDTPTAQNFNTLATNLSQSEFIVSSMVDAGYAYDISGVAVSLDAHNTINNLTCSNEVKADLKTMFCIA